MMYEVVEYLFHVYQFRKDCGVLKYTKQAGEQFSSLASWVFVLFSLYPAVPAGIFLANEQQLL